MNLFAGPNARTAPDDAARGVEIATGQVGIAFKMAYPPFAYVMTVDWEPGALPTCNITSFVDVDYDACADLELQMLIGFGHTPVPLDYRTKGMIGAVPDAAD